MSNFYSGIAASQGIAISKLRFCSSSSCAVAVEPVFLGVDAEKALLSSALETAKIQLDSLYQKALESVGDEAAMIFEIHGMMLEDLDFLESIDTMIQEENHPACVAVAKTGKYFSQFFASMDDAYMKARSADILDVSNRLEDILLGRSESQIVSDTPFILAAEDLTPSQTIQMDKSKVLGMVTKQGSSNSHTAILARTLGIPAVVALGDVALEELDGKEVVLDGQSGCLSFDLDAEERKSFEEKSAAYKEHLQKLESFKGLPNETKDGRSIKVYANIGNPEDAKLALESDCGGIGLFRSEFLYLENTDYPDEETQFEGYKKVLEIMDGKDVIIRTLDIGADKQIDYFSLPEEENPALGMRAIRICLTRPEIFKTQLRALYRASVFGKLSIMFPMITSLEEVVNCKNIVTEVQDELKTEGVAFDASVPLGIMIETPAAAVISDLLAKEVDFFSVGTNDLSQYTLALDRQNADLESFYNPHNESVLRLIKYAADSAHAEGIWIGICGELAGDLTLTERFLEMGIDELSVSPKKILALREKIRSI